MLRRLLAPDVVAARGLFRQPVVDKLMADHEANRIDGTDALLALMNLEIWSRMYLDKVVTTLKGAPTMRIRVEGHTDNQGDDAVNQQVSQARAEAVRDFLISQGIGTTRVEAVGYGETRPIDTNSTEAGRARNRRIEFRVLSP